MVALVLQSMEVRQVGEPALLLSHKAGNRYVDRKDIERISLRIEADAVAPETEELRELLAEGADHLEIVLRRRAARPQDVQSHAAPAHARTAWPPTKKKAKQAADVPETTPEPEEPTTASNEEFGSWG